LSLLCSENKDSLNVSLHEGWLYIGEQGSAGRIAFNETTGETQGNYQKIITGLTADGAFEDLSRLRQLAEG